MATTATAPLLSAEQFLEWTGRRAGDGVRYELEDGRVVEMPSPGEAHALVCWFVIKLLTEYVVRRGSGHLLTNDCGLIVRRGPDTVRGPDVMLFLDNRTLAEAGRGHVDRVPALVVEVFSPSDRPGQVNRRVEQYLARGVPMVWVAYPEELIVTVHRPGSGEFSKTLDETDDLSGNGVLPDFACKVADLFALPSPPAT